MIEKLEFKSIKGIEEADREKYKIHEQQEAMKGLLADLYHEQAMRSGRVGAINRKPSGNEGLIKDLAYIWAIRCMAKILEMKVSGKPELADQLFFQKAGAQER
jgi:hypothetical protein